MDGEEEQEGRGCSPAVQRMSSIVKVVHVDEKDVGENRRLLCGEYDILAEMGPDLCLVKHATACSNSAYSVPSMLALCLRHILPGIVAVERLIPTLSLVLSW